MSSRSLTVSLAVAAVLAAAPGSVRPAAAETPAEFEALLRAGFPCPQPAPGPVRGQADADAVIEPGTGEPAFRAGPRPAPTVSRSAEGDLALVRWAGVTFRTVSEEFPILVEEGTVGLMIRAQAPNDRFRISVELMDPSGALIACEDCAEAPAVGEINAGRGTTQIPSTDRPGWELAPGRYTFRVRATPDLSDLEPGSEDVTVDITATLRTDAAVDVRRFLDLNFIYLPGCGLNRETAPASPEFLGMIDAVAEALAPTGIEIGAITHRNLYRPGFSLISDWDQVANLFRGSGGLGRERALNVYCVRGFEEPLYPAVGLSGGIPGPIDPGTPDSGIIIRLAPLFTCNECTDAFASLFVHEFGHYLGLYHTTEATQTVADPFSDTPRCDQFDLRQCPDWPYVMFPVIHPANRLWSPGQIAVVQTHPMVSTVPVVGGGPRAEERDAATVPAPVNAGPNPFREVIDLEWSAGGGDPRGIGGAGDTRVAARVYDVAGRMVRDLGSGVAPDATFRWDGADGRGAPAPDGVYFVRFTPDRGAAHTLRIVKVR